MLETSKSRPWRQRCTEACHGQFRTCRAVNPPSAAHTAKTATMSATKDANVSPLSSCSMRESSSRVTVWLSAKSAFRSASSVAWQWNTAGRHQARPKAARSGWAPRISQWFAVQALSSPLSPREPDPAAPPGSQPAPRAPSAEAGRGNSPLFSPASNLQRSTLPLGSVVVKPEETGTSPQNDPRTRRRCPS